MHKYMNYDTLLARPGKILYTQMKLACMCRKAGAHPPNGNEADSQVS